jgi:TetR/AcrR family transcriptional regulator, tetracycline repressor protein
MVDDLGRDGSADARAAQARPGGGDHHVQRPDVLVDQPAQALGRQTALVDHDPVQFGVAGREANEPPDALTEPRGQHGRRELPGRLEIKPGSVQLEMQEPEQVVGGSAPERFLRREVIVDLRLVSADARRDGPGRCAIEPMGSELLHGRFNELLADDRPVRPLPARGSLYRHTQSLRYYHPIITLPLYVTCHNGYDVPVIVCPGAGRHTCEVATTPGYARDGSPARRSRGRPPVPLDRIVATALQIVDEEGADALSMRVLAQRLDSGTATLYRHFAGRAELIAQVVDRVFGEAEFGAGELAAMTWQQACHAIATTMYGTLSRHQNVAPLLAEHVPIGPNAMALRERCLAVLLDNGFPPRLAARAYATLARYVLGFAIQLSTQTAAGSPEEARRSATFRGSDPSRFPATAAVADALPVPLEEEFTFGLELLLNGLSQLLHSDRRRSSGGPAAPAH